MVGFDDPRVKEVVMDAHNGNVGYWKRQACANCSGDVLIELDHDDLLLEGAVEEVRAAFEDDEVVFVYSDTVRVQMGGGSCERFSEAHGWEYYPYCYNGENVDVPVAFEPTPASVSRIWYAPDHLRAFRRSAYEACGGYNVDLPVLDDQDLMSRLYLEGEFKKIPKPLYVYRVHGGNTWLERNQLIQDMVYPLYDTYIAKMAQKWAKRRGLLCLDLGGRIAPADGYITVDRWDAGVECDLNGRWPFDDGSVGVVRAFDIFEHLRDPLFTMKELYRVLAPGGYAFIQVPSTDGRGAFQDPTHVSFWNENSFFYYTKAQFAKYIDTQVKFQAMRLYTTSPNQDKVCWTVAHLVALKGQERPPGIVEI